MIPLEMIAGLFYGLSYGLVLGLIWAVRSTGRSRTSIIQCVETLRWSWSDAGNGLINGLFFGSIVGSIVGLVYWWISEIFSWISVVYGSRGSRDVSLFYGLFVVDAGIVERAVNIALGFCVIGGFIGAFLRGLTSGVVNMRIVREADPKPGRAWTLVSANIGNHCGILVLRISGRAFSALMKLSSNAIFSSTSSGSSANTLGTLLHNSRCSS
jgi:hypothetical protein